MTNLEFIKTINSGVEIYNFLKQVHYVCIQSMAKAGEEKEVWKNHCLSPEYRGESGCKKCMVEFWGKEVVL